MKRRTFLLQTCVVSVLASLITGIPASSATALSQGDQSTPPAPTYTVSASRTTTTSPQGASPSTTTATITCNLRVDYPHSSSHVPGTANVEMSVLCTAAVPSLTLTPYLYPPVPYATIRGATRTATGSISVGANAATGNPCPTNGYYQGYGYAVVKWPPNYYPSSSVLSGFGNSAYVQCLLF